MAGDEGHGSPVDFNECVSRGQLQAALDKQNASLGARMDTIVAAIAKLNTTEGIERVERRLADLTGRMDTLEARLPSVNDGNHHDDDTVYDADGNIDRRATQDARLRRRLQQNRQGMGGNNQNRHGMEGNNQNRHGNDDPFAKVKFIIPSFASLYDADIYLDWEMTVEQKFNSHLVPEQHRVRQATSEFKDFAIIWWNELSTMRLQPDTWERLKEAMRNRFVPPSYKLDLRKKLQRLEQGDRSVQDYYAELQKGMMRCGVVEDTDDKICRFYGGLRREIQDIVDYKEFTTVNQLFQLAMLAEKELQGRKESAKASTG